MQMDPKLKHVASSSQMTAASAAIGSTPPQEALISGKKKMAFRHYFEHKGAFVLLNSS